MPDYRQQALRAVCCIAVAMLFTAVSAGAGQAAPQASEAQIRELRATLDAVQAQLAETRRQADALQQKVDAMESQLTELRRAAPSAVPVVGDQDLLAAKVEDQEQTKVASGSKYRMRLSGFVLVNLFGTHGAVDSIDVPRVAVARGDTGAFGASVRQSSIGLEVFGASIGGARTSGELTLDFFGGFPVTPVGVTEPLCSVPKARSVEPVAP